MPLLHGEIFKPISLPENIKPDEEVFVCQFTKEVFRNYDDFFSRVLLCKSSVWCCPHTGQQDLTYQQALKSEEDFIATLNSIQTCHKKSILSIVHHSQHTNFNSLVKEVFLFFKERYIVGEELEYHSMNGSKRSTKSIKILDVILKQSTPIKTVTTTTPASQPQTNSDKPQTQTSSVTNDDSLSSLNGSHLLTTPIKQSSVKGTPASSPMSLDVSSVANEYSYVIQFLDGSKKQITTLYHNLSRPRKSLTKEKIKLFLKNALERDSEKSPFKVKPYLVEEFHLGPSTVIHDNKPTVTTPSVPSSVGSLEVRKRTSSQTSLDSFFSPSNSKKPHPLKPIVFNPLIQDTPKSSPKVLKPLKSKSPKKKLSKGSASKRSSTSKNSASKRSLSNSSKASKGTPSFKNITPKVNTTPGLTKEVKKILKRSKSLKQLDVRKSLVKTNKRASVDSVLMERRKNYAELKAQRLAEREQLKEKMKQDRLKKNQELREKRRMEKLEQLEKLKPREDQLCEDSKPLPFVNPLPSSNVLFPEIVTIMEFLHHYGSTFNISDVIPNGITYGKLEEALTSCSTETILFDLVKFLLQAIFSAMEEEHEDSIEETSTATVATTSSKEENENGAATGASGSRRSSVGSIPVEGLEDQENRQDIASVTLSSIRASAQEHAVWSQKTQASSLQNLALNVCTCSEVLRLHLMSGGGHKGNSERQWFRFCNRGGYTDSDDPAVELRLTHPSVIDALSTTSFFDMEAKDKALIVSTLCYQLLMFSCSREAMEEILTQSKQIRKQLRELRFSIGGSKKKNKQQPKEDEQESNGDQAPREKRSASEEKAAKEEEEQRKVQVNEEIAQLEQELYPLTAAVCLKPLGTDRYYNKYWVFPSLPGLYIEHFIADSFDCCNQSPKQSETSLDQSETEVSKRCNCSSVGTSSPTTSSAPSLSHDLSLQCDSSWSLVSSDECFQALLSALNPLGLRESKLKMSLERIKGMVFDSISNCTFLENKSDRSVIKSSYCHANDCLELQLREQILDLEEKLYMGNLGYVRDTCGRKEWREKIESSGAAQVYAVTNGEIIQVNGIEGNHENETEEEKEVNRVTELANVLLQIQLGIEKKYLLSPLGTAVDMKKKGKYIRKNGSTAPSLPLCVDQWRTSLQKATSFAQIFVHLSTLERSVAWSKSLMNVRCRLCRRKGGDEYMLLCDGCDHGYHTYCLRPPLTIIPDGDWFCNDCCPVTPVKRRRTVSMVSLKELSDSDSDEPQSGSDESVQEEESEQEDSDEDDSSEKKRKLRASTRVQARQYHTRGVKTSPVTMANTSTRSRKRLKLDDEGSNSSGSNEVSHAEMIISAIIDMRCSKRSKSSLSQNKAEHTLEIQLCKALLDEMTSHKDSWPFLNPVRRREFPDYHEVITKPMDLKTVKHNISTHKYKGLDDFLKDINQVFINCSTYHKRHSKIGKAGASLRKFVEQRYSDLGMGNLASVTVSGVKNSPGLRSSTGI